MYGAAGGAQDHPHVVPLHLPLLVRVVLDAEHHRTELLVHCREVLVVITEEMCAIGARRVVNLKLGLHFIGSGVLLGILKPPYILLGARIHPVSSTLHKNLGERH